MYREGCIYIYVLYHAFLKNATVSQVFFSIRLKKIHEKRRKKLSIISKREAAREITDRRGDRPPLGRGTVRGIRSATAAAAEEQQDDEDDPDPVVVVEYVAQTVVHREPPYSMK